MTKASKARTVEPSSPKKVIDPTVSDAVKEIIESSPHLKGAADAEYDEAQDKFAQEALEMFKKSGQQKP